MPEEFDPTKEHDYQTYGLGWGEKSTPAVSVGDKVYNCRAEWKYAALVIKSIRYHPGIGVIIWTVREGRENSNHWDRAYAFDLCVDRPHWNERRAKYLRSLASDCRRDADKHEAEAARLETNPQED